MPRQYSFDIVANTNQVDTAINEINAKLTNLGKTPVPIKLKVDIKDISNQLSKQKIKVQLDPTLNNKSGSKSGNSKSGSKSSSLFGSGGASKSYSNVRRLINDSNRIAQNTAKKLPTYAFSEDVKSIGKQWQKTTRAYLEEYGKQASKYGVGSDETKAVLQAWNDAKSKRNLDVAEYYTKQVDSLQKAFDKNYTGALNKGYSFAGNLNGDETQKGIEDLSNLISSKKNWDTAGIQEASDALAKMKKQVAQYSDPSNIMMNPSTLQKYANRITNAMDDGLSRDTKKTARDYVEKLNKAINGESNISLKDWRTSQSTNAEALLGKMQKESGSGSGFLRRLGNSLRGQNSALVARWFSTADMINYAKQMANATTQVDSAITELRKVSNASPERLQQTQRTSAQTAQQYGTTISDVIQSTAQWSRLGNSVDDAEKLAKISAQFIAVGDDMDQESVETTLTSVQRAWNQTPEQLKRTLDSINQVKNVGCPFIVKDIETIEWLIQYTLQIAGNS